jgi:hypothetical protein
VENKSVNTGSFDFKNILDKYFTSLKAKKDTKLSNETETHEEGDFNSTFAGKFKNNLFKLRAINSRVDKSVDEYGDEKTDEK